MTKFATLTQRQASWFNWQSKHLVCEIIQHFTDQGPKWDRQHVVMRGNFILTLFFATQESPVVESRQALCDFLDALWVPYTVDMKATFPDGSEYYSLRLVKGVGNSTNIEYITVDEMYGTVTFQLI